MAIQYVDDESFKEQIKEGFVIVDFFSTTCVPCKAFSRILEELDAELPFINIVKLSEAWQRESYFWGSNRSIL